MPGDPTTPETAPPRREPLIPREELPPDLDDVRLSQLLAVRRAVLEARLDKVSRHWLSWSRHLGALPLDLLDAWFEGAVSFYYFRRDGAILPERPTPPDGPGRTDPEAETMVAEFLEDKMYGIMGSERYERFDDDWIALDWWEVPDGGSDAGDWLTLTAEAQAAWLCGPDGWFPAYRDEPAAPYRVVRMKRLDVEATYEIGPERPSGFPVRFTTGSGRRHMYTWDHSNLERTALHCGPPEELYWAGVGTAAPSSEPPEA